MRDLLTRYAKLALGKPFTPGFAEHLQRFCVCIIELDGAMSATHRNNADRMFSKPGVNGSPKPILRNASANLA